MKRSICAVILFSLLGWKALAGELEESLAGYEAALKKGSETPDNVQGKNGWRASDDAWMRLRLHVKTEEYENAINILKQRSADQETPEAKTAANRLMSALTQEQEKRLRSTEAIVTAAIKQAAAAVKTARTAADLDAAVAELGKCRNLFETARFERQANSQAVQNLRRQLEDASRFADWWQEYLSAMATGDAKRAGDRLENILRINSPLLPRSEILAKMPVLARPPEDPANLKPTAEEYADDLIAKTRDLEEMGALLVTLRKAGDVNAKRPQGWGRLDRYIRELSELERGYREFQAGLPVNTNLFRSVGEAPTSLIPLKNRLLLLVLPRYITAPDSMKPKDGETVDAYLNRVMEEAKEKGDAALAFRARLALRKLQQNEYTLLRENNFVNDTQAAKNQEAAGQYALAVVSYQNALKAPNELVPVHWIERRLGEIKKSHPAEYNEGMQRFLNPEKVHEP